MPSKNGNLFPTTHIRSLHSGVAFKTSLNVAPCKAPHLQLALYASPDSSPGPTVTLSAALKRHPAPEADSNRWSPYASVVVSPPLPGDQSPPESPPLTPSRKAHRDKDYRPGHQASPKQQHGRSDRPAVRNIPEPAHLSSPKRRRVEPAPPSLALAPAAPAQPPRRLSPDELRLTSEVLGEGASGPVFRGQCGGLAAAVKNTAPLGPLYWLQELEALSHLVHPNIVRLLGVIEAEQRLLLELCSRGSLFDLLHSRHNGQKTRRRVSEANELSAVQQHRWQIMSHVASALAHVHAAAYVHGDVSSKNVLLCADWTAKLTDFGLSRPLAQCEGNLSFGILQWRAPELMGRAGRWTAAVDCYGYGVVLWELLHLGNLPWAGEQDCAARVLAGRRPPISEVVPLPLVRLVTACWAQEPLRRPAMVTVCHRLTELERRIQVL